MWSEEMRTAKIVETYSLDVSPPPHGDLSPSSGTTQTGLHARRRYRQLREQSVFLPTFKKGRDWLPS